MHLLAFGLRIALAFTLIGVSTVLHVVPLLAIAVLKAVLPVAPVRRACNVALGAIAESWVGFNSRMLDLVTSTRFTTTVEAALARDGHYLVLANHQSWVDIPVMQYVLNRRIPLLRFFLKRELFWVPLLGLAWWALDFPFMRRYSRDQLARNPHLLGKDIEATRRACEKFRDIPVSITNFVEGTRFTPAKRAATRSPFRHLLRPKAGGAAFVIDAMRDGLHAVLDVTIVYPDGRPGMLDLFGNRLSEVRIDVRERPIPREFFGGDYQGDAAFRQRFKAWMNGIWQEKDARIESMLAGAPPAAPPAGRQTPL
ncbi:MAG: acyltransferase [Lysobacteraceae bacterium]|nr:MAG: acyltransferase [Xanthomonadaceae bacterium]